MQAMEIRNLRDALGENRPTFGARFHRSGRTVEGWERGERNPDALVLVALRKLRKESRGKLAKHMETKDG